LRYCAPLGRPRGEELTNNPGPVDWYPYCLTVYDYYGNPVNVIPES